MLWRNNMKNQNIIINKLLIMIAAVLTAVLLILPGCKEQSADTQNNTQTITQSDNAPFAGQYDGLASDIDTQQSAPQVPNAAVQTPSAGLDFAFADIQGNKHRLSDNRGKKVIIIFWATWCPPCKAEIPHLIALRKMYTEDQLAMIAISDETPMLVKRFAETNKMNYTITALDSSKLPNPLNRVEAIPTSFYLDSKGEIKQKTVGYNTLEQIQATLDKVKL
jgi:thiol-disulfide isomerase/thioredoxin